MTVADPAHAGAVLEVTLDQLQAWPATAVDLIDVRSADEYAQGSVPGARHLPAEHLLLAPERHLRGGPTVLVCTSGRRSLATARALRAAGWSEVWSLTGGYFAWRTQSDAAMEPDGAAGAWQERYARHLRLPAVGAEGQRKLAAARIALVGVGGLGSPIAYYLAAAGVGQLRLIDADRIERSNLQRQILYQDDEVGRAKVECAAARLGAFNPDVRFEPIAERLSDANAPRLLDGVDVVIDGSDNFPTRYAVNRACLRAGIPWVYGAVERFQGEVAVFDPRRRGSTPCYACIYPQQDAPPALSCAEAGVLGVLPGLIGIVQALEALKLMLAIGTPLLGRMLRVDALTLGWRERYVERDPGCAECGG